MIDLDELIAEARTIARHSAVSLPEHAECLNRLADALEAATRERDAALAALERVRVALVRERAWHEHLVESGDAVSRNVIGIGKVEAALDGAPEPEWEYGFHFLGDDGTVYKTRGGWDTPEKAQAFGDEWIVDERESHMLNDQPDIHVALIRRRKAGHWLPVEGENE